MTDLGLDDLPRLAREMAEVLGLELTLTILQSIGGCKIKVPRHPASRHRLTQWVGPEAARAMAEHFGGEELELPRIEVTLHRRARATVMTDLRAGRITTNQAARLLCLTHRRVRQIRSAGDTRQAELFSRPRPEGKGFPAK